MTDAIIAARAAHDMILQVLLDKIGLYGKRRVNGGYRRVVPGGGDGDRSKPERYRPRKHASRGIIGGRCAADFDGYLGGGSQEGQNFDGVTRRSAAGGYSHEFCLSAGRGLGGLPELRAVR